MGLFLSRTRLFGLFTVELGFFRLSYSRTRFLRVYFTEKLGFLGLFYSRTRLSYGRTRFFGGFFTVELDFFYSKTIAKSLLFDRVEEVRGIIRSMFGTNIN